LKTRLNRAEAIKKRTVLKAKRESWMKYLKSLETTKNPKEFWNYVRRVINGSSYSPTAPIKDPTNEEATDDPNRS